VAAKGLALALQSLRTLTAAALPALPRGPLARVSLPLDPRPTLPLGAIPLAALPFQPLRKRLPSARELNYLGVTAPQP
jgi:hypothetical protein